ncbi:unnamed protein product, partial [Prorocentrum cordatum]
VRRPCVAGRVDIALSRARQQQAPDSRWRSPAGARHRRGYCQRVQGLRLPAGRSEV